MANIKISELDEKTTLNNNDYLVIDDGTTTKKATKQNLLKEVNANKQDKLVSGQNIKTINGESLLGSEDIEISPAISYQTGEVLTGGTWIDGKPIYRGYFNIPGLYGHGTTLTTGIAQIINAGGTHTTYRQSWTSYFPSSSSGPALNGTTLVVSSASNEQGDLNAWIEYTKV